MTDPTETPVKPKTVIARIEALESGDTSGGTVLADLNAAINKLVDDSNTKTQALSELRERLDKADEALSALTERLETAEATPGDAAAKSPAKKKTTKK